MKVTVEAHGIKVEVNDDGVLLALTATEGQVVLGGEPPAAILSGLISVLVAAEDAITSLSEERS